MDGLKVVPFLHSGFGQCGTIRITFMAAGMRHTEARIESRRHFLKQAGTVAVGSLAGRDCLSLTNVGSDGNVVKNKTPLAQKAVYMLPLGAVRPMGWLKKQIQIQANGLSGHLDETWPDVGNNSGWLGGTGESWERGPYFLDGLIPLAYQLNDSRLEAKAQKFIAWSVQSQTR